MAPISLAKRVLQSARTWIALSIVAPIGMLGTSGFMLLDLRQDAWERAEQTSRNLLQALESDIARNIELFDLSIQAAVDNLNAPGVSDLSPILRQLVLFDRAATARDMGVMIVINEHGDIIADIDAVPPRKGNYADRDYFLAHKRQAGLGLFVGHPLVSRLTGERMLPFSRRITKPDGSFGGVVLGSVKLSYFTRLFGQLELGRDGAINLYLRDGTRVIRQPYIEADIDQNISSSPTFKGFTRNHSGSFVKSSVRDGIERHYTFTQIGDLPLILNVALSTSEIESGWRTKALVIGIIVLVLCSLTIALSLLFARELRRRAVMQAKFEALSVSDALTDLPNRRAFEIAGPNLWNDTDLSGKPLSLLIVDADHFKRFNDIYGHHVGDEVLRGLANCLSNSVHRPADVVCRMGGEEFVLLLPNTDEAGAFSIAEKIHAEIRAFNFATKHPIVEAVTVSIGLSSSLQADDLMELYRIADAALYEAKVGGRNQTKQANLQNTPAGMQKRLRHFISGTSTGSPARSA